MRKLITLLCASAMLTALAVGPAFAQVAVDDSVAIDNSDSVEFHAVAQNVIGSIETGDATQNGDATAVATDDSVATATVDADLDTSVDVVNHVGNVSFVHHHHCFVFGHCFGHDLDLDGVLDEFDWVILFGDFDNDGLLDHLED